MSTNSEGLEKGTQKSNPNSLEENIVEQFKLGELGEESIVNLRKVDSNTQISIIKKPVATAQK